jgi:amino acid adenylation domain-containing protein
MIEELALVESNEMASNDSRERCVYELFEAQAERVPDAVALVCGEQRLSYAELNARANRLARLLREWGVGPEVTVGVMIARSVEMVVALLSILKAGGAYVPLDPSYPSERLDFMLADSQAAVLLTHGNRAKGLAQDSRHVIRLDDSAVLNDIARQRAENLPKRVLADNLAYVIYTSGSTGRPKGAMITHRGLVNYLSWCVEAYGVAEGSGAPVHSSISFDLTVTSLFSPLVAGRCVELLSEERGVEALAAALVNRDKEFSLIKITPAHLVMLNHLLPANKAEARVRVLVIGGEALRSEIISSWRQPGAGKRLINEYGPTETVVGCIVFEVGEDRRNGSEPEMVLIGRPIANTESYVLDDEMKPAPIGVAGELYLGGEGVARGYLNRPEITAERFVPHPFTTREGERLYRTGDLARYLESGELEYLGRSDYQVKVRGYRIELGEVESRLREYSGVSEAVVMLHEDASGSGQLVGYVAGDGSGRLDTTELRKHLRQQLPEHMVPVRLVELLAWPLTPNGKIDRQGLAAAAAAEDEALDQSQSTPPLQRIARDGHIPLSFAQQPLWLLQQLNPKSIAYNLPAAFVLRGHSQVPVLEQSLAEVVRRHESLRTTFAATGGRPRQVIAETAQVELPLVDLSGLARGEREREVERQRQAEAVKPFDLSRGPLLRTTLLRLAPDEHVLLLTMHHIISDGWSMRVLLRELVTLYEALEAGRESPLAALPVQYADYAVWQRGWLTGEVLEGQLEYWREQLAGAPPVLELPTDYPRPAVPSYRGATQPVMLDSELVGALKKLSQGAGTTLFMTLLGAWATLLSRYSGQTDVVIGVPVSGRNRAETEGLIGFFVNTLPLRIAVGSDGSFRQLLRTVRRAALGAYAHQDSPFEKLVEGLQPVRDRSRAPLFQVSLVWDQMAPGEMAVSELELGVLDASGETAKFDLTLMLTENADGTVSGDLEYSSDLFAAETIERLRGTFRQLLIEVCAEPSEHPVNHV